jgi:dolichyl-phosphate-mannose-protein mannosyltransferase
MSYGEEQLKQRRKGLDTTVKDAAPDEDPTGKLKAELLSQNPNEESKPLEGVNTRMKERLGDLNQCTRSNLETISLYFLTFLAFMTRFIFIGWSNKVMYVASEIPLIF